MFGLGVSKLSLSSVEVRAEPELDNFNFMMENLNWDKAYIRLEEPKIACDISLPQVEVETDPCTIGACYFKTDFFVLYTGNTF